MRSGLKVFVTAVVGSLAIHLLALVGVAVSARPKPFAASPAQSIAVDLVSPEEIAKLARAEPPKPQAAIPLRAAARPPESGGAAAAPAAPPPAPSKPAPAGQSPFDPTKLAGMFPVSPVVAPTTEQTEKAVAGFDAPADKAADLAPADVAAFKAHLRRCMTLPAGITAAERLRVVLRIALGPDGVLRAPPTLVEATASPNGPAMVRTLVSALSQCQPYNFLPAEKYAEWKVLDLAFTPRDLAGG